MRRRDLVKGITGSVFSWPLRVGAQQPPVPVIGFLSTNTSDLVVPSYVPAFVHGLSESGFIDGQNVAIQYRWANNQYDQLPALAGELVRHQVDVIVAVGGTASALAAKAATTTIPVIFNIGSDPVKLGLVASLNRPGGNITGISYLAASLVPKLLETLHEALPNATNVAVIVNSKWADSQPNLQAAQTAALTLGQKLLVLNASTDEEINSAFKSIAERQANALVVIPDPFLTSRSQQLVTLAAYQAIPAIYAWPEYTALGGLMSYGTSLTDAYYQVGIYAAKVLKGAKPAQLPVQQAVKVELILNLKTAKTLGITFPLSILGRADEVIE